MIINKLPKHIVNILSAGEVVERPYSVVKELVENAIDAKADSIIIDIKNGGKTFIKVEDNWIWIDKEDLPYTIEEYATSKISKIEDIYNLSNFWFRWEALSTISEVSKFKIITKKEQEEIAFQLEKYGQDVKISPTTVNFSYGSAIFVQDLFYNVPVRKKFLKSDQTEFKYIQELVQKFAIRYFDISFKLIHNDKVVYDYGKTHSLLNRLKQIYPSSWSENYLFIEHNDGIYSINAVIGKSILKFNSSNNINIFVNQRPVKDKIIQKAIMQAYSRWLEPGMCPFVVLFLDLKPNLVDVNVHPRKEEVKFYDIDISMVVNSLLHSSFSTLSIDNILEQVLATKACKTAIKANHKLSSLEMKQLIQDGLKFIDGFFVCQHGRPSVVKLSKQDIDGLFDRK